ncbi:MAG TPA: ribbon-helix-helix domain-containing protein [Alteraurantiacibacter sp.]
MGEETVRWTILVDKATDINLRTYLAQKGMKKGDLSKFVEDAVNRRLFRSLVDEFRAGFADMDEEEVAELAEEAITTVRKG